MTAKILCVESDAALLESRCEVLKVSGYDTDAASPQAAAILLRNQSFDLVIVSNLSDRDLHSVLRLTDNTQVMVLHGVTKPSTLLFSVAQSVCDQRDT